MTTEGIMLSLYKQGDSIELFITPASECFIRQSGLAKLCKVSRSTIARYLANVPPTIVDTFTSSGFMSCALYNEDVMLDCIRKFNPEIVFGEYGFTSYLHRLVGY